jgi:chromosomal replication initiation ATPase DnaA
MYFPLARRFHAGQSLSMTITHVNELTTDELCAELDRRMSRNKASKTISAVAEVFGVHPSQIFAYDKQPTPSQARTLAMALVSEHHTLAETARIFQRKNHTTIISAKQRADVLTRTDSSFREKARFVLNKLKA